MYLLSTLIASINQIVPQVVHGGGCGCCNYLCLPCCWPMRWTPNPETPSRLGDSHALHCLPPNSHVTRFPSFFIVQVCPGSGHAALRSRAVGETGAPRADDAFARVTGRDAQTDRALDST